VLFKEGQPQEIEFPVIDIAVVESSNDFLILLQIEVGAILLQVLLNQIFNNHWLENTRGPHPLRLSPTFLGEMVREIKDIPPVELLPFPLVGG